MSTRSKVIVPTATDLICQGDIFKNVKYNYIDAENDDSVDVVEYEFPLAIVVSQACDVIAMDEIITTGGGKPTKYLPSVLLCPIYDKTTAKTGEHLSDVFNGLNLSLNKENVYHSDDYKIAERDWHYRFHALELVLNDSPVLSNAIIDFKHYFTVPITYLITHKGNRLYHLDSIFAEQITLKFATYLSRVAIP